MNCLHLSHAAAAVPPKKQGGNEKRGTKAMVAGFTKRLISHLRGWIGTELVSDVPSDLAACEFECKRPECSEEKFGGCERRRLAAAKAVAVESSVAAPCEGAAPCLPAAATRQSPSMTA